METVLNWNLYLVHLHWVENLRTQNTQLNGPLRSVILGLFAKFWKRMLDLSCLFLKLSTPCIFCIRVQWALLKVYFVMSVCPSVRPDGTTRLLLEGFSWNLIYKYITKICGERSSLIKSDKNNGSFTWKPMYTYDKYLTEFTLEWNNFTQNCRETQNTHFIFSNFFLPKIFPFTKGCGKIC